MIKHFIFFSFSFCAVNINPVTVLHPSEGNISFQPQIIFSVVQGAQLEIIILHLIKTAFCLTSELSAVPLQILGMVRQGELKAG